MSKLLKSILVAATFAAASANAAVVTFDGYYNTIWGDENPTNGFDAQSYGGYNFVSSGDHFHFIDMADYGAASNGTSSMLGDRAYSITMTKVGGGAFNLLSLLGYAYGATQLSVTGNMVGGGSINTAFNITQNTFSFESLVGFENLSSVVFQGLGGDGGFGVENLEVSEGSRVPEPASIALIGLALAGAGFARKGRR